MQPLRSVERTARYGGSTHRCPVCRRRSRRFAPYGSPPRPNRACPFCGALQRHRLLWLFLERDVLPSLADRAGLSVLHTSPERPLAAKLRSQLAEAYVPINEGSTSESPEHDLMDLSFGDASFDLVITSHVLEHVSDDRQAVREIRRVLKPEGLAVVLVPIRRGREVTDEDPTVLSAEARMQRYGHPGHRRLYGADFADRMTSGGFTVTTHRSEEITSTREAELFVIGPGELIFTGVPA